MKQVLRANGFRTDCKVVYSLSVPIVALPQRYSGSPENVRGMVLVERALDIENAFQSAYQIVACALSDGGVGKVGTDGVDQFGAVAIGYTAASVMDGVRMSGSAIDMVPVIKLSDCCTGLVVVICWNWHDRLLCLGVSTEPLWVRAEVFLW